MYSVEKVNARYENSQCIQHQGNRASVQPYLRNGFRVKEERSGWWLLTKCSQAVAYLECPDGQRFTFDARAKLLTWYGGNRLTQAMVNRFVNDFYKGKLKIYVDERDFYICNP